MQADLTIKNHISTQTEIAVITREVYALLQQNTDPATIAVIYNGDEHCAMLKKHFGLHNTPFYNSRCIDTLAQPLVKKIIQVLRYINAVYQNSSNPDALLFEILHYDFYRVPPVEIDRLAKEAGNKKRGITATGMRRLLIEKTNAPAKDLFDTGIDKNLKAAGAVLEKLITYASVISPGQLFEMIVCEEPLKTYMHEHPDHQWLQELLTHLHHFIQTQIIGTQALTLNALIEIFDKIEKEPLPLPYKKTTGASTDVKLITSLEAKENKFDHVLTAAAMPGQIQPPPEIIPEEAMIRPVLDKFIMSVSALNCYLQCPIGFYYKNIIRIPDQSNEAMIFGSAVHHALEKLFKKMSTVYQQVTVHAVRPASKENFSSVTGMMEDFNWYMHQHRTSFTTEVFKKRLAYGAEILANYYTHYADSWNKNCIRRT